MWMIISAVLIGIFCGSLATYLWLRRASHARFGQIETQARAHAHAIAQESERLRQEAKIAIREQEIGLRERISQTTDELEKRQKALDSEAMDLRKERNRLGQLSQQAIQKQTQLDQLRQTWERRIDELIAKSEQVASMTQKEARELILAKTEEQSRSQIAGIIRRHEQRAKEEGEKRAHYILAQATTRYAGEFAGERLINLVTLPSDEHKGRIIGKEGRNIKTLEMLLGVDIVVDETPGVILVSSFNLYRRAIATRVLELLVEDGRIHPGRIEEVHEKVEREFEKKIYEEGESIVLDMGLFPMHEELMRLLGRLKYRASYGQNALAHTLEVARLAGVMAAEMGGDEKLAARAGLLHDIGKALTQEQGGSHVELGAEVCRRYNEHPTVINAIYAHHDHEEPDSVESAAVCAADTLSAARPGARREVLERFAKRVVEIEKIAMQAEGVCNAYAINGGRELRVFVQADRVNDNETVLIGRDIAAAIEQQIQYPGEIKVTVIREKRAVEYAK
jgi:ribonuclease Y